MLIAFKAFSHGITQKEVEKHLSTHYIPIGDVDSIVNQFNAKQNALDGVARLYQINPAGFTSEAADDIAFGAELECVRTLSIREKLGEKQ